MGIDPIEELLLRAYPNPDRKGCPGSDIIQALGNKELPSDHPVWQHVWKCSPCFAEFRELRDARLAKERSTRTKRFAYLGAVAALFLIGVGAVLAVLFSNHAENRPSPEVANKLPPPTPTYQTAVLNLESTPITRSAGKDAPETALQIQRLPRRSVELTVYLRHDSQTGDYRLEFLDASGNVLISQTAAARVAKGLPEFTARVDLQSISSGTYTVRSRRLPDGKWMLSRVIIE